MFHFPYYIFVEAVLQLKHFASNCVNCEFSKIGILLILVELIPSLSKCGKNVNLKNI